MKRMKMNRKNKEFLFYVAGLFDGEGSVSICRATAKKICHQHFVSVSMGMTDNRMVNILQKIYGGHIGINNPTELTRKLCYVWKLDWNKSKQFLLDIEPYTILKKKQVKLGLKFFKQFKSLRKDRTKTEPTKKDYKQLKLRDSLWEQMRILNGNTRWTHKEFKRIYV